ncbi:hypothetical protein NEFER03_2162 [Nematocida sp. LUAm3]|nr:hypothetical protein NEFER03_2162 [Nematocida sp. LUAm3]KAI5174633.1 hypothetical protein NEFER02_0754 [Nematocida sp. LUAm2]KAI5177961.1 hypothetical protein NEFER01_1143 [Nematocida sp. LUAm1]
MKEIEKLSSLMKRVQWISTGYRESAAAYGEALNHFMKAASSPRETLWKSDSVMQSFIKYCDTQSLALQSLQTISSLIAEDLDGSIEESRKHLLLYQQEEEAIEVERTKCFEEMQEAVATRNRALKGESDLWKADIDLKAAIKQYVKKEIQCAETKKKMVRIYFFLYNDLLKKYFTTLREYLGGTSGHLNMVISEVKELSSFPVDYVVNCHSEKDPEKIEASYHILNPEERVLEIYTQAVKETDPHNGLYPFLLSLSVKGCCLFYFSKFSSSIPIFIVYTSTEYLHAFSATHMFCKVSNTLFMVGKQKNSEKPMEFPNLGKELSLSNEQEVEEICHYFLQELDSLQPFKIKFPFSVSEKNISLSQNGKEIHIEDKSAVFFTDKIRLKGLFPQQTRSFFSLFPLTEHSTPTPVSTDDTELSEGMLSWYSATFNNPWN